MPNNAYRAVDTPIEVTPTTLPDQLFALMRQLTLIFGGFGTLLVLLKTKDIAGILAFLRDSDFVALLVGAGTLASLIYGNLRTRWTKKELIVTAEASPDRVAKVVSK